jgi:hypothetical protein
LAGSAYGYLGTPVVKALPGGGFGYLSHRNYLTSDAPGRIGWPGRRSP